MGLETRTHVLAVVACGAVDHFLDDDPLQWKRVVVGWSGLKHKKRKDLQSTLDGALQGNYLLFSLLLGLLMRFRRHSMWHWDKYVSLCDSLHSFFDCTSSLDSFITYYGQARLVSGR